MAAKKKRGRKMPAWKRYLRAGVRVAGTTFGAFIAFSPTYRGLKILAAGDIAGGANAITKDMAGIEPASGDFIPDVGKIIGSGVAVGAGIGIMLLFREFAKRV